MEDTIISTDEVGKTLNTSPAHPLALESTMLLQSNETEDQNTSSHQTEGEISLHSQETLPIGCNSAVGMTNSATFSQTDMPYTSKVASRKEAVGNALNSRPFPPVSTPHNFNPTTREPDPSAFAQFATWEEIATIATREEVATIASCVTYLQGIISQLWEERQQAYTQARPPGVALPTLQRPSDYRPPFPPRQEFSATGSSQESQIMLRLRQEKAFKSLMNSIAIKFDGKDAMEYAPWKEAFINEKANLHLTAAQELQLLDVRTELEPNQIIKDHRFIQIGFSPEAALASVWKSFDRRYHTQFRPSHLLVNKLTQGPILNANDASTLFSFQILCHSAIFLQEMEPAALSILDDPGLLDSLVSRLDQIPVSYTHLTLPTKA